MSFLSARMAANLSQAAVAAKLGVTDAAVCMWETGKTLPRATMLPRIAALYGCTIDDLFSDSGAASPTS